jgi:hypothetical protein
MSNIDIRRAVDTIRSGTTVYTPVIELIVNAIQAIPEDAAVSGNIRVVVLRSQESDLFESGTPEVDGFAVSDDGVGFTQINRDAFDTLYTANKLAFGGKGFGRFTCLKYYDRLTVDSVFREGDQFQRRTFDMGTKNSIIEREEVEDTDQRATGTTVTISGARHVKMTDRSIDIIARVLVEKLLPYLVDEKLCPTITVEEAGGENRVVLNDYVSAGQGQIVELDVVGSDFSFDSSGAPIDFRVRVFKFYSPRTHKSKISLVAHRREVTNVPIHAYVPEFADEFFDTSLPESDGRDRNYIVKAYVYGAYLDDNVSLERGAFSFGKESDMLLGVSQTQIEQAAAEVARVAMGADITTRRERKLKRIEDYVAEKAPWHASVAKDADFTSLPMHPSPLDIELHLQRSKHDLEIKARTEVASILAKGDISGLGDQVAKVVSSISQTSKNDLIHYVSMRKCVLDLFEKSLEVDADGHYRSEGEVHDIIIPRRKDSLQLDYKDHNLWILDERLNFTEYLTSDLPIDGPQSDRADVSIFNRKVAFRGENDASNPIIIFEFKRPLRQDFANPSSDEDPVDQIVRYVNKFRAGKFTTPKGRDIKVSDTTPFYGYVVLDLTKKVEDWLRDEKEFVPMPDGLGWFQWRGNIRLYIEVLSWDKIRKDAEMRNRVFFDKLGI